MFLFSNQFFPKSFPFKHMEQDTSSALDQSAVGHSAKPPVVHDKAGAFLGDQSYLVEPEQVLCALCIISYDHYLLKLMVNDKVIDVLLQEKRLIENTGKVLPEEEEEKWLAKAGSDWGRGAGQVEAEEIARAENASLVQCRCTDKCTVA